MGTRLVIMVVLIVWASSEADAQSTWHSSTIDTEHNFLMRWLIGNDSSVSFEVSATCGGYIAIAFSPRGFMKDSWAVIGAASSTNPYVTEYELDATGAVPISGDQILTSTSINKVSGVTTMAFSRPLQHAGRDIVTDSMIIMLWALHDTSDQLIEHTSYGGFKIDLSAGGVVAENKAGARMNAHAVLMYIAMGVMFPIGVMVARFVNPIDRIPRHSMIQMAALVVAVIGFSLVVAELRSLGGSHFTGTHSMFGLIGMILFTLQTFSGPLKPDFDNVLRRPWTMFHIGLGSVLVIIGQVLVVSGWHDYNLAFGSDMDPLLYVHFIVSALLLGSFVWLEIRKRKSDREEAA